jgi:hypothetical protein
LEGIWELFFNDLEQLNIHVNYLKIRFFSTVSIVKRLE